MSASERHLDTCPQEHVIFVPTPEFVTHFSRNLSKKLACFFLKELVDDGDICGGASLFIASEKISLPPANREAKSFRALVDEFAHKSEIDCDGASPLRLTDKLRAVDAF